MAEQIQSGMLVTETGQWSVPDQIQVKIGIKEKKGRLVAKLRLGWSSLGDYDKVQQDEIANMFNTLSSLKIVKHPLLTQSTAF